MRAAAHNQELEIRNFSNNLFNGVQQNCKISMLLHPGHNPADRDVGAADLLYAFEGGTGDKGLAGEPHSQSLMGYVLMRWKGEHDYDVHVVFRGSRSGTASRALLEALSDEDARGNPDWITDMGYDLLYPDTTSCEERMMSVIAGLAAKA